MYSRNATAKLERAVRNDQIKGRLKTQIGFVLLIWRGLMGVALAALRFLRPAFSIEAWDFR
jgi:hypothetical protein